MSRLGLIMIAVLGCSKPTRDCPAVVAHMKSISSAKFGPTDEARVLAACKTWPQPVFDCLMAATNDAAITTCETMLKQ